MKKKPAFLLPLFLALTLLLSGCDSQFGVTVILTAPPAGSSSGQTLPGDASGVVDLPEAPDVPEAPEAPEAPDQEGYYYDLEHVVLYLFTYGELPPNYITKSEARDLGWEGGSVERYLEGAAIGGDRFGNREGLLPQEDGRRYTECDLNTDGASSRGAERLIFSNDGLYFYTENHYESFLEVWVEDGEVVLGCEPFV
jgi:guanyl-specific ribonuclease Sa